MSGICALGALGLCRFAAVVGRSFGGNGKMIDKTDCYFDPECHTKADWEKVGAMKTSIFSQLESLKQANDADAGVNLLKSFHDGFAEAGVPQDRIDYILTKWVEYVYPQMLDHMLNSSVTVSGFGCANGYGQDNNQEYIYAGTTKDGRPVYRGTKNPARYIYYDSFCAQETKEPRWLLGGKPNVSRDYSLNTKDGKGCENDFSIVSKSKHLPGGQQKLDWNWCGDHGLHGSETVSIIYEIKGVAAAIPRGLEHQKDTQVEDAECKKYATWSEEALMRCRGCRDCYPDRVDGCMTCGKKCSHICQVDSSDECYKGQEFGDCHGNCMSAAIKQHGTSKKAVVVV